MTHKPVLPTVNNNAAQTPHTRLYNAAVGSFCFRTQVSRRPFCCSCSHFFDAVVRNVSDDGMMRGGRCVDRQSFSLPFVDLFIGRPGIGVIWFRLQYVEWFGVRTRNALKFSFGVNMPIFLLRATLTALAPVEPSLVRRNSPQNANITSSHANSYRHFAVFP